MYNYTMNFDTNKNSVWLEGKIKEKFHEEMRIKYDGIAPTVFQDRIKACLKSLKVKKITDLSNVLLHDHVLSILHHACKDEHNLICSHYKWSNYEGDIEKENNDRLTLAGDYSFELDQIAELKRLSKGSIIYKVKHADTKAKYYTYTYFYLVDNKPISLHLRSFGFKYCIHQTSPYHNFTNELGEKLKGDSDYYKEVDL